MRAAVFFLMIMATRGKAPVQIAVNGTPTVCSPARDCGGSCVIAFNCDLTYRLSVIGAPRGSVWTWQLPGGAIRRSGPDGFAWIPTASGCIVLRNESSPNLDAALFAAVWCF